MKINAGAIVSNSEMTANYKSCRDKAGLLGKLFIFKNNQPDAVLFSNTEYERLSEIIEYLDSLDDTELAEFFESLPKSGKKKA